jgi:hypothetical protein
MPSSGLNEGRDPRVTKRTTRPPIRARPCRYLRDRGPGRGHCGSPASTARSRLVLVVAVADRPPTGRGMTATRISETAASARTLGTATQFERRNRWASELYGVSEQVTKHQRSPSHGEGSSPVVRSYKGHTQRGGGPRAAERARPRPRAGHGTEEAAPHASAPRQPEAAPPHDDDDAPRGGAYVQGARQGLQTPVSDIVGQDRQASACALAPERAI